MKSPPIAIAFVCMSLLFTSSFPATLYAQRKKLTDFREGNFTVEGVIDALREPDEGAIDAPREPEIGQARGDPTLVAPQRPAGPVERPSVVPSIVPPINFAFDSDQIRREDYSTLDILGTALTRLELSESRFWIEGHTDSMGSDEYNLGLSKRRAESVRRYLVQRFNVAPQRLMVRGYGESQPLTTNETEAGRAENRRVEVVNVGINK